MFTPYIIGAIELIKLGSEFLDASQGMTEEEQAVAWEETQRKYVASEASVRAKAAASRARQAE